jgi:hypothetical protein
MSGLLIQSTTKFAAGLAARFKLVHRICLAIVGVPALSAEWVADLWESGALIIIKHVGCQNEWKWLLLEGFFLHKPYQKPKPANTVERLILLSRSTALPLRRDLNAQRNTKFILNLRWKIL